MRFFVVTPPPKFSVFILANRTVFNLLPNIFSFNLPSCKQTHLTAHLQFNYSDVNVSLLGNNILYLFISRNAFRSCNKKLVEQCYRIVLIHSMLIAIKACT